MLVLFYTSFYEKIVSKNKPSKSEMESLIFAFKLCKYVKSNAILLAKNKSAIGIGAGQPNRLDSCNLAIENIQSY